MIQGEYLLMSGAQRRRVKRRRNFARSVKRGFKGVLLAPGRIPRITDDVVSRIMGLCEGAAIFFVIMLMLHMAMPDTIGMIMVIISGMVFAGLMLTVGLADYQDKLAEYELYGFKI